MLKIIIEGDLPELKGVLAALLESATPIEVASAPSSTPEPTVEDSAAKAIENAVRDAAVPPPSGQAEMPPRNATIRDIVMEAISRKPGLSTDELAEQLNMRRSQIKTAISTLHLTGHIDRELNARGQKARPARWSSAEPKTLDKPAGVTQRIVEYVRDNPMKSSMEIATGTGIPYSRVTSVMNNLMTREKVTKVGKGGYHEPYRYTFSS